MKQVSLVRSVLPAPGSLFCSWLLFVLPVVALGQSQELRSHVDPFLDYPIRVVEARPYLRMGDAKLLGIEGYFKVVHRELGALSAERLRLPVPGSTWKLTGRVGRAEDGTIIAGFGTYLYWSTDEGKSWTGRRIKNLPSTGGKPVDLSAFGVGKEYIYIAHQMTALPQLNVPDRTVHPMAISRSKDKGLTWESTRLTIPAPYKFLAGDGNHIIELGDGSLLAALATANSDVKTFTPGWLAQVFFRGTDKGKTWGDVTYIYDTAAEVGLLSLGGMHVLAARRGGPNTLIGGKTVQLANSDDGGRTWKNLRQLTWVFGQAHGDVARLPGGGVVAVYENRYPRSEQDIRARVSWDNGDTWEPEVYILAKGMGYAGSVASSDGTIITVTGDGEMEGGKPAGRGCTLQALRWKPYPKPPPRTRSFIPKDKVKP